MRVDRLPLLCLLCALLAPPVRAESVEHLVSGAEAFRQGQFSMALVEFEFARQEAPEGEASWYVAATLVKLQRTDDALEAFLDAEKRAPSARDALFNFYEAIACYDARLYTRADALLSRIGPQDGPHLAGEATRLRARIAPLLAGTVDDSVTRWYLAQAERLKASQRLAVAALYEEEARALAGRGVVTADAGGTSPGSHP